MASAAKQLIYVPSADSTVFYSTAHDQQLATVLLFTTAGGSITSTECTAQQYSYTTLCVETPAANTAIKDIPHLPGTDCDGTLGWTDFLITEVVLVCGFQCQPYSGYLGYEDCASNASWAYKPGASEVSFPDPTDAFQCAAAPNSLSRNVFCLGNNSPLGDITACGAVAPVSSVAQSTCTAATTPPCSACDATPPTCTSGSLTYSGGLTWEIPCATISCACVKKCSLTPTTTSIDNGFDCAETDNTRWNYASSTTPACTDSTNFTGSATFSRFASCAYASSPTVPQPDGGSCTIAPTDNALTISAGLVTSCNIDTPATVNACVSCGVAPTCTPGSLAVNGFPVPLACDTITETCACSKNCSVDQSTWFPCSETTLDRWIFNGEPPQCDATTFKLTSPISLTRFAKCVFTTGSANASGSCDIISQDTVITAATGVSCTLPSAASCPGCNATPTTACTPGTIGNSINPCPAVSDQCACKKVCSVMQITDWSQSDDFVCTAPQSASDLVNANMWNLDTSSLECNTSGQLTSDLFFTRFVGCRFVSSGVVAATGSCAAIASDSSIVIPKADSTCTAPVSTCTKCNEDATSCTAGNVRLTYNTIAVSVLPLSCPANTCECVATCKETDSQDTAPCPSADDFNNVYTTIIADDSQGNLPTSCSGAILKYTRDVITCTTPSGLEGYCTYFTSGTVPSTCTDCSDCGTGSPGSAGAIVANSPTTFTYPLPDCACTLASCAKTGTTDWKIGTTCDLSPSDPTSVWGSPSFSLSGTSAANSPSMCNLFDTITWARDVKCTLPGSAFAGVFSGCTSKFSNFSATSVPTMDYMCDDSVLSCTQCGTGTATPLTITLANESTVLSFGSANIAACNCACGLKAKSDGTIQAGQCPIPSDTTPIGITWARTLGSADPVCQDSKTTFASSLTPTPPSDSLYTYSCVQNGVAVGGECSSVVLPTQSQCQVKTSCTQCNAVDTCNIHITGSNSLLIPSLGSDTSTAATCEENCGCDLQCTPLVSGHPQGTSVECAGVVNIDPTSSSNVDICSVDTYLGDFWRISCVYKNSESVATDCTGAETEVTTTETKKLIGDCEATWLCLRAGGDPTSTADYVNCDDVSICGSTCNATPLAVAPVCLLTADANDGSVAIVTQSTLCSTDTKPVISSASCTCQFFCVQDPSYILPNSTELDTLLNDCTEVEFTLPTQCDQLDIPGRAVFTKSLDGVYTKLSVNPTAAEGCTNCDLTRTITTDELNSICFPGIQCVPTGETGWAGCEQNNGFPTCDAAGAACGLDLKRDVRCTWKSSSNGPVTDLSGLLTILNAQTTNDGDIFSSASTYLSSNCQDLRADPVNLTVSPCPCTNSLSCLKTGSISPYTYTDFISCDPANNAQLATSCDVSQSCDVVKQDFTNVYCRNTEGTYNLITSDELGASPCNTTTFPQCAGAKTCITQLICNDDPTTPAADLIIANASNIMLGYNACDIFSDICYKSDDATFQEQKCTENASDSISYIQARASRCLVVSGGVEIMDTASVAILCPSPPPSTEPNCIDYSGCSPSILSPVVSTPDSDLRDRKYAVINFEYHGPTAGASTNLNVEWSYPNPNPTADSWTSLLKGVDATKNKVTVTLPRLDRTKNTQIIFRLFITPAPSATPVYLATSPVTVQRLDSCTLDDICKNSGTLCMDPTKADGKATCVCKPPTLTPNNAFTSDATNLVCTRTAKCDAASTAKCKNGGYLTYDSSISSTQDNSYQCTSTCTCPNGFDSANDCASCSSESCSVANGQARATTDTACGCKICFPGFSGSTCSQCSRVASITIADPTLSIQTLFGTNSAQLESWYAQLVTSIASIMSVERALITVNSKFSSMAADTKIVTVVFEFSGLCASPAAFITQATTTPTATELEDAWKTNVTPNALSDSDLAIATSNPTTAFTVQPPSNLATCSTDSSCPAYAPALSCETYPTYPSCVTSPPGPDSGESKDNNDTTTIIVVVVVVVGVVLIAVAVILIICCCCTDKSSSSASSTESTEKPQKKQRYQSTEQSDHLELV